MKKIKRIGVLTGGGDCPGLNAVIRAVVNTATRKYGIEVYGIRDGYSGLIHDQVCRLELKDVSGILPRGGTILGTSNRDNPFQYPVKPAKGRTDSPVYRDVSARAAKTIAGFKLDALITIGGDGTQSIAFQLSERYPIRVIGIPKTIDNDLGGTDVTFGFDTALGIATNAIDRLHSTAEAHHRVMIIEVMGRYAGWIALEAGIAGGGDVILIPEIPFRIEKIVKKIRNRIGEGKRFSLVVVAEGAKEVGGDLFISRKVRDPNDPVRLGGISQFLGNQIENLTGIETRDTILGHVQRGGSPSPFDRVLATRFGYHAVEAAAAGESGCMIGLHGSEIGAVPLQEAVSAPRRVKPDSDLVKTAMALGTCFGV
jgi:phosphofructokinase-like protein